jgi:hypothetical protein
MAQQTVVELLHQQSNELITQYLNGKIDKRELLTMHHNLLYPHKQMEKQQIIDAYNEGQLNGIDYRDGSSSLHDEQDYYNKTYGKQ